MQPSVKLLSPTNVQVSTERYYINLFNKDSATFPNPIYVQPIRHSATVVLRNSTDRLVLVSAQIQGNEAFSTTLTVGEEKILHFPIAIDSLHFMRPLNMPLLALDSMPADPYKSFRGYIEVYTSNIHIDCRTSVYNPTPLTIKCAMAIAQGSPAYATSVPSILYTGNNVEAFDTVSGSAMDNVVFWVTTAGTLQINVYYGGFDGSLTTPKSVASWGPITLPVGASIPLGDNISEVELNGGSATGYLTVDAIYSPVGAYIPVPPF